MKQKTINSFFAKPASAGTKATSEVVDAKRPATGTDVAKENILGEADPTPKPEVAEVTKKRRRLKQVIEDSPAKSEVPKDIKELEDDLEDALPSEPATTKPASTQEALAAAASSAEPVAKKELNADQKKFADMFNKKQQAASSTPSKKAPSRGVAASTVPVKAEGAKASATDADASAAALVADGAAAQGDVKSGAEAEGQMEVDAPEEQAAAPAKKIASIFAKPEPKPKAKAAGAAGKKASGSEAKGKKGAEEDDEVADGSDGEEEEEGQEEERPAKRAKSSGNKVKTNPASKMDGVGHGAIAAAAKHEGVKVEELVGGRWKEAQAVPFEFLADTFEAIAETSKRLEIVNLLVNCFRAIIATTPEDLLPAVYLCTNRVAPAHLGIELGIGEATLIKALAAATGRTEQRIKDSLKEEGDLGIVAVKSRATQKTLVVQQRLTIRGVLKAYKDIATTSGKNSQKAKEGLIVKLLVASKGNETGYVMRSLQAKLRIGLAEQSVLVALGHAVLLQRGELKPRDPQLAEKLEEAARMVKVAFSTCPSYDVMIPALLQHPLQELLQHCQFTLGVPVRPMLAKATNAVGEVLEKFQDIEFTCEYKYDGERAQIHVLEDGSVMIFSRNAENNTGKYPDIVQRVHGALKPGIKSIVFDSEAVAWDKEKKKILPFQVLSTRKRKDVEVSEISVQVCIFAFDCLYINGRSLLKEPLSARREALYGALQEREGEFMFATAKTSTDVEELQRFLDDAVEQCTEGLIVKTLHGTYEPARRSSHWLKLKKDYLEGVGDTFDVVPVGAFYGKGKRTGVFGAYLLAIYDPDTETYQTISKLGTGFSEEQLAELAESMTPHIISGPRKYYSWGETLVPDVWFDAVKVWEVKAADLSISPRHKAAQGLVDPDKGISIRFPRLMRVRDDKGPEDATTAEQVADMFRKQAYHKAETKGKQEDDDFDF
eukprot:CAMPEP_0202891666 /NCGR_PEP_ID=MMETSP1392-20130828/1671_1 /ASSEMBLY_ACC=CAM_ASM_000868 /TAXON_ID=225041 /ORGANISM="Chlamydomonas chlamydogama, Strain SAG 11-48b" /LENGTH=944 /DNA_ID=CAMNT_0049575491 /DNA_START=248 /DNA_END=3082 /DNA_ORIENTATION=+